MIFLGYPMKKTIKLLILASFCSAITHPAGAFENARQAYPSPAQLADAAPAAGRQVQEEAPATQSENDFFIIAGDVLQITVWKEEGMDREVLVLPDGTVTFPLIGTLQVRGLTPSAVQAEIKEKLKKYIPDASVTVMVKAPLGHTVSVIGQVVKSGEVVMGRHMDVMEALSQAGGLTPYASTSHIVVLRYGPDGKKSSIDFPYDDVAKGRDLDKDIELKPGDVVVVPTAGLF
jgi:polysaccharide export outer membrane protein